MSTTGVSKIKSFILFIKAFLCKKSHPNIFRSINDTPCGHLSGSQYYLQINKFSNEDLMANRTHIINISIIIL